MPVTKIFKIEIWDIEWQVITRLAGLANKLHISLLGCPASLATVAKCAGTNNILPAVFTTLVSWQNMIYGKLMACF